MFTHPQHIIEIHKRQVRELIGEQNNDRVVRPTTSPGQRPTNGRSFFAQLKALVPSVTTPRLAAQK